MHVGLRGGCSYLFLNVILLMGVGVILLSFCMPTQKDQLCMLKDPVVHVRVWWITETLKYPQHALKHMPIIPNSLILGRWSLNELEDELTMKTGQQTNKATTTTKINRAFKNKPCNFRIQFWSLLKRRLHVLYSTTRVQKLQVTKNNQCQKCWTLPVPCQKWD